MIITTGDCWVGFYSYCCCGWVNDVVLSFDYCYVGDDGISLVLVVSDEVNELHIEAQVSGPTLP